MRWTTQIRRMRTRRMRRRMRRKLLAGGAHRMSAGSRGYSGVMRMKRMRRAEASMSLQLWQGLVGLIVTLLRSLRYPTNLYLRSKRSNLRTPRRS